MPWRAGAMPALNPEQHATHWRTQMHACFAITPSFFSFPSSPSSPSVPSVPAFPLSPLSPYPSSFIPLPLEQCNTGETMSVPCIPARLVLDHACPPHTAPLHTCTHTWAVQRRKPFRSLSPGGRHGIGTAAHRATPWSARHAGTCVEGE
eukprot:360433-Chlamydomonas_euryale.AAC.19